MRIHDTHPTDLDDIRQMCREYQAWVADDVCFQQFEQELAGLPGAYAPPDGALFIARSDTGDAVGMIALRRRDASRGEMKRLFVRDSARGLGVGRALVERVLERAREIGYTEIVLDTLPVMAHAQAMYERIGFKDIAPYSPSPMPGVRYMALRL